MANTSAPAWGFYIAAVSFLGVAIAPLLGGARLETSYFILGIVFLILGLGISRRNRAATTQQSPPP